MIILSAVILLFAAVLFIDILPPARRWEQRIKSGCWQSRGEWEAAALGEAIAQAKKMPAVTASEQTRFTVIERLRGKYKSRKLHAWQRAALLLGCGKSEAKKLLTDDIGINGGWKIPPASVDSALLGYAVLLAADDKASVRPAMDSIFDFLKKSEKGGTVPYNNAIADIRFVDTVGMICPFLYAYAKEYSCPEAAALAARQLHEYFAFGVHSGIPVPVHCFDTVTKAPLGIYGWGRGCGWLALGLAGSYENAPEGDRAFLLESGRLLADGLIKYQSANGSWCRQVLARDVSESSATAMIGCFMAVLSRQTDELRYRESAERAMQFIMSATRRNGIVDYAQGDTMGIGFYSKRLDKMPAVQGFSLMLAHELEQTVEKT